MKRFLMLQWLEMKKYWKALPALIPAAVILVLVACGVGLTGQKVLKTMTADNVKNLVEDISSGQNAKSAETGETGTNISDSEKIQFGIAVQDKSKAVKLVKKMLGEIKSLSAIMDVRYISEEEGRELLKENKLVALMIVREKTISGVMNGNNVPVEIVFPEDSGYEAAIFKEYADAAAGMLSASQAAIYSIYDFYDEYGRSTKIEKALDRMNMFYIAAVLGREDYFEKQEVVATGELSVVQYYICGGIVLFLMFFAIVLVPLMRRNSRDIAARLKLADVGYLGQVTASVTGAFFLYLVVGGMVAALAAAVKKSDFALKGITYEQMGTAFLMLIPAAFLMAAFTLFVCRLTDHVFAQVMILFFAGLLQGFVSGCFVPKLLLPKIFDRIAEYFPAYYMIEGFSCVFTERMTEDHVIVMLGFGTVFLIIAAVLERFSNATHLGRRVSS